MTKSDEEDIDELTMLALGRVIWNLIKLESTALHLAEQVQSFKPVGLPVGHHPAGDYIQKAALKLQSAPLNDSSNRKIACLLDAEDALKSATNSSTAFTSSTPAIRPNILCFTFPPAGRAKEELIPLTTTHLNAQAAEFASIRERVQLELIPRWRS
ncbi:hypothetical protein I6E74_00770 [Salinibacterium sp. SWN139]|uniref:hypothetical protein n=1 Tax=Salinibacterium sp. SWN139 TaxID=2792055 RepID=UPI0018CCCFF9|nr:hypothetical protein [Salinibacterium sp. SWN139]MBH0052699.1 hypothetical protein [Salinibacterium sp. SWN139]